MQLNKRLDTFELKLRQLSSKFERQQAEKNALAKENRSLKQELDRQHGVVSSLREKLEKASSGGTDIIDDKEVATISPEVMKATRAQIDACIQELDHCIEWLEKH